MLNQAKLQCALHNTTQHTMPGCVARPGSTDTSLWTHYKAGKREYCGNAFQDGMVKNDRLPSNVITPTTKV
eukprot:1157755-Pelagomonas_calceolata.AAC.6